MYCTCARGGLYNGVCCPAVVVVLFARNRCQVLETHSVTHRQTDNRTTSSMVLLLVAAGMVAVSAVLLAVLLSAQPVVPAQLPTWPSLGFLYLQLLRSAVKRKQPPTDLTGKPIKVGQPCNMQIRWCSGICRGFALWAHVCVCIWGGGPAVCAWVVGAVKHKKPPTELKGKPIKVDRGSCFWKWFWK